MTSLSQKLNKKNVLTDISREDAAVLIDKKIVEIVPISDSLYCQRAIALKKNIEVTFLALGEMLKNIRDEKKYVGSYESFDEFLADLDLTESYASKMITVFEFFREKLNISEEKLLLASGHSNLYEIYLLAKDKEEPLTFVNETLETLATPQMGGKQKLLRQMKKGVDTISCTHADSYLISCCRACGERIRVYPEGATSL